MSGSVIVKNLAIFKIFFTLFYCMFACADSMSTVTPIKVAMADQSVISEFVVKRKTGYTFAVMFVWAADYSGIKKQRELWRGLHQNKGVSLPIHLRILKDGEVFFDETIITAGVDAGAVIEVKGQKRSVGIRTIKNYELMPGRYIVKVNTVGPADAFRGEECYMQFATYDRKI
ncbi:hypothetical protein FEM54_11705 [Pseudomonas edaphica]|uniref:DUF5625 domain-containing protein n=1 Tax=Pseudomonas edaphica TaxID=2006980 RepID=A0ABY2U826_9PSED|nr:DUF5625 family protein [Pseudomonas edaphica]TLG91753.1 hypothetical protein FEM54_11705 [Pseudomonas edaphica]